MFLRKLRHHGSDYVWRFWNRLGIPLFYSDIHWINKKKLNNFYGEHKSFSIFCSGAPTFTKWNFETNINSTITPMYIFASQRQTHISLLFLHLKTLSLKANGKLYGQNRMKYVTAYFKGVATNLQLSCCVNNTLCRIIFAENVQNNLTGNENCLVNLTWNGC